MSGMGFHAGAVPAGGARRGEARGRREHCQWPRNGNPGKDHPDIGFRLRRLSHSLKGDDGDEVQGEGMESQRNEKSRHAAAPLYGSVAGRIRWPRNPPPLQRPKRSKGIALHRIRSFWPSARQPGRFNLALSLPLGIVILTIIIPPCPAPPSVCTGQGLRWQCGTTQVGNGGGSRVVRGQEGIAAPRRIIPGLAMTM